MKPVRNSMSRLHCAMVIAALLSPAAVAMCQWANQREIGAPMQVSIHTNDANRWRAIPGVGQTLSNRLSHAAAAGFLRDREDLVDIAGIGPDTAATIGPHLAWTNWDTPTP